MQVAVPGEIEKVAGDGQVIAAGSTAAIAPQVRMRDAQGLPMAGQVVEFTDDRLRVEVHTNAEGIARYEFWTIAGRTRTVSLVATVPGTALRTTFSATVVAGPAVMAGILVQPSDSATSGVPLARQPVAELHDEYGNPVHLAGEVVWLELDNGANVGATLGGTTTGGGALRRACRPRVHLPHHRRVELRPCLGAQDLHRRLVWKASTVCAMLTMRARRGMSFPSRPSG